MSIGASEWEWEQFRTLRRRFSYLALTSHLIFVIVVLALSWSHGQSLYCTDDTHTYVKPARNLIEAGAFSRENAPPFVWEPYRLPGYPLLIALAFLVTGRGWPVLLLAPLFAALGTYVLVSMSWHLRPSIRAAKATGIIAAFFPNSLGLSAMMLTDAIGGCLFVVAFFLTVVAIEKPNSLRTVWSALCWVACQMIRPSLALAGLFVAGIGLARARSRRQWIVTLSLVVLTLPVPLWLSFENYQAHGIFQPSLLGMSTMREYLFARVEASGNRRDYDSLRNNIRHENALEAEHSSTVGKTPYGRLYQIQRAQIQSIIADYGWSTVAKVYAIELLRQTLAPWDFLVVVLIGKTVQPIRIVLALLYGCFLLLALFGTVHLASSTRAPLMLAIWFSYFLWLLTGAVSTYVGSRLRFPGDLLLIPLAGIAVARLIQRQKLAWCL